MNINSFIKIITILSFLMMMLLLFPTILSIFQIIRDKNVFLNYKDYKKIYIHIDSINSFDGKGANAVWTYGYSKELNHYKTTIQFGQVKKNKFKEVLGMNDTGEIYRYIWYNKNNIKNAYPAKKNDAVFSVKEKLLHNLLIPFIWLFTVLSTFFSYKISVKKGLFNQKNKNS